MTDDQQQLVEAIAKEVIAVLRARGVAAAAQAGEVAPTEAVPAAPSAGSTRTQIQPPAGVCTGDYSKFPELAGRLKAAAAPAPDQAPAAPSPASTPAPAPAPKPEAIPLTGIVTATQLEEAIKSSPDGVAVLALDARLTPLAHDLARQRVKNVRRLDAPGSAAAAKPAPDAQSLPWLWWIDGSCPVVQQVTTTKRERLRRSAAGASPGALAQAVRDLAAAIKARRVAGGLLFVHSAARAVCLANRCASIRAVVGTCGEAVEEAVQQLGANVLIIEYPHHGLRSTLAMVERIMQAPPQPPPAVERDLAELHRCG